MMPLLLLSYMLGYCCCHLLYIYALRSLARLLIVYRALACNHSCTVRLAGGSSTLARPFCACFLQAWVSRARSVHLVTWGLRLLVSQRSPPSLLDVS
ncbi:hypothetical protein BV20DRAFT_598493 [Pilatotrama ljubarskyi]|nr:hypothetical protein BV20DRAFT_598493 [Pilatotrama ljubarskyi]